MNIRSKAPDAMRNERMTIEMSMLKMLSQIPHIQHHFSDINAFIVLNVSSSLWSCSISHIKCKVDARKYLSMLLIAEINENSA